MSQDRVLTKTERKKRWFGCGVGEPPQPSCFLMCFHERVDGFLAALGADLQVVAVVRERLFTPLAAPDSRCFHLRDLFEQ